MFDLTRHLLTNHAGSGKAFYIGHWEGDWHLLPQIGGKYATQTNLPAGAARENDDEEVSGDQLRRCGRVRCGRSGHVDLRS
jgi:hypothetical protein